MPHVLKKPDGVVMVKRRVLFPDTLRRETPSDLLLEDTPQSHLAPLFSREGARGPAETGLWQRERGENECEVLANSMVAEASVDPRQQKVLYVLDEEGGHLVRVEPFRVGPACGQCVQPVD